ncbi:aldo/keto reductase, partial [Pseudomonas sp. GW460-11-11-14-LB11]
YKDAPALRPQFDFSYDGVMRSVEESLDRLGLDRVDVLLVHDPDDHYDDAVNGAFRALMRLRDDGTVKAIGSGMNQSEMLTRFAEAVPVD